jgi:thioredoxin reductase (NADPH)
MTSYPIQNENVLVVGGGDTAAEYVQCLRAQVNRVTLSYRQAEFTRLSKQNNDPLFAMEERKEVEILRGSNIKEVKDEAGRPRVVFKEPEFTTRAFDRVIYAMGRHHADKFSADFGSHF